MYKHVFMLYFWLSLYVWYEDRLRLHLNLWCLWYTTWLSPTSKSNTSDTNIGCSNSVPPALKLNAPICYRWDQRRSVVWVSVRSFSSLEFNFVWFLLFSHLLTVSTFLLLELFLLLLCQQWHSQSLSHSTSENIFDIIATDIVNYWSQTSISTNSDGLFYC